MKFDLTTEVFNEQLLKLISLAKAPAPAPTPLSQLLSSLLMSGINEERASPELKAKRFALLGKISAAVDSGNMLDLNVDELALITPLIDANCPTVVFGRIKDILNAPMSDKVN